MRCDRVLFSGHAVRRMFERGLTKDDILRVIRNGEVIGDYPDDRPYPSCLMLGTSGPTPIHVVVAMDVPEGACYVVTAYVPDPGLWSADFRTRRKK